MSEPVKTNRSGHVLEITLDRPKANAIDAPTSRAMDRAFETFRDDPDLRVAILTGGGARFFSAGWDMKSDPDAPDRDFGKGGFGGITGRFDLDKPVIAAVNGYCAGGGLEVALACDFILAAEHAVFFLSETMLGMVCHPASVARLLATVPRQVALEMLFTGRHVDAAEAKAVGLALDVAPGTELMARARALAARIAEAAPLATRATKEMIREAADLPIEQAYAARTDGTLALVQATWDSEDAKEGPRAFAEKRKPNWTGR
jgi:crotonobetainyl-CoA hydratase